MVRIQLLSVAVVLLSMVHAQSQMILGRETYCVATASLVKDQPNFIQVNCRLRTGGLSGKL